MEKIIIMDKVPTDCADGRKWEIEKQEDGLYKYTYYEYFTQIGWQEMGRETDYPKKLIEELFDIKIDDNSITFINY